MKLEIRNFILGALTAFVIIGAASYLMGPIKWQVLILTVGAFWVIKLIINGFSKLIEKK